MRLVTVRFCFAVCNYYAIGRAFLVHDSVFGSAVYEMRDRSRMEWEDASHIAIYCSNAIKSSQRQCIMYYILHDVFSYIAIKSKLPEAKAIESNRAQYSFLFFLILTSNQTWKEMKLFSPVLEYNRPPHPPEK